MRLDFVAIVTALALSGSATAVASDYAVVAHWNLGPVAKWDYATFDAQRHRVFVAHGDKVLAVDSESGRAVGEVPAQGAHGIALAPTLQLGFSSNGQANSITAFDLDTLQPRQQIAVSGDGPDAILYEAAANRVYAFNGRSNNVSVIDARTLREIATIAAAGKPEFAVADGAGKVYFNVEEDAGRMQVIDVQADRIVATWDLAGCSNPTGLSIDSAARRLFSVCANEVLVVTDAASGKQVARLPIGTGPDAAAFDPASRMVFSANGRSGTLTLIQEDDADHFRVVADLPTQKSARTMAFDPGTHRVFLPAVTAGDMVLIVVAPR
jgi:YVTN family beta-propeller protein